MFIRTSLNSVLVLQHSLVCVSLLSSFPASHFFLPSLNCLLSAVSPSQLPLPSKDSLQVGSLQISGQVFIVVLINALPFWVAALIDQPIADTARSAGCFEAMKERIQLS